MHAHNLIIHKLEMHTSLNPHFRGKIVVDMSDYANGQITVETCGFSAVVKGQAGQRVYHRRFPLPQDTVIDGVVADLSDDNILTVTAPRKVCNMRNYSTLVRYIMRFLLLC